MPALARNQASDCLNPILDIFTFQNGIYVDVFSLEFQIFEKVTDPMVPVQVYPLPAGTRQAVNVTQACPVGQHLSTGHYAAIYTPPISELIGTHQIRWFFKLTALSPEQSFTEEFEVLSEVSGAASDGYCTIADLRDEGVTLAMLSDLRAQKLITRATRYIDRFTGRFFTPKQLTVRIDGRGGRKLHLGDPIIAVQTVDIIFDSVSPSTSPIDTNFLKVYNRHISQNLTSPDDRENPLLEFVHDSDIMGVPASIFSGISFRNLTWPKGPQNIRITGLFGYTDYDGSLYGKTPELIQEACMRLVIRNMTPLATAGSNPLPAGPIVKEKTRDQEVQYANLVGTAGKSYQFAGFSGDPAIDMILLDFSRPMEIRGV